VVFHSDCGFPVDILLKYGPKWIMPKDFALIASWQCKAKTAVISATIEGVYQYHSIWQ
jgi:hypothetical protein